jgi:hypothetical protein
MEEIRNQKRKRRKENKNIKLGLREPFRPRRGTSPRPRKTTRIGIHLILSLSLTGVPHMSGHVIVFFPRPKISPVSSPEPEIPPLFNFL